MQVDAHIGGVNDLAFAHLNKQLCIVTCGDDKLIKVHKSTCDFGLCVNGISILSEETLNRCGI